MPQRILVAVDLSDASMAALKAARALATARGATLAVVHVAANITDVQPFFPQSFGINLTNPLQLEGIARDAFERRVKEVEGCEGVERFFEIGPAYAEIVRRAETWKADLVVVGSHGRTGLSRTLLGSVAERVVRAAHCAVLVSRPSRGSKVVMVATDLSDPSLPAVARGVEEARLAGARLLLAHAIETPFAAYGAGAASLLGSVVALPSAEDQQQSRALLQSLLGDALQRLGAEGEPLVLEGGAVAALVRAVDEQRADLLVIGTHGRAGIARLLLGSVAESLVRLADCSVLVVRKPS